MNVIPEGFVTTSKIDLLPSATDAEGGREKHGRHIMDDVTPTGVENLCSVLALRADFLGWQGGRGLV